MKTKIVYNGSYGGFDITEEMKEYIKLKGISIDNYGYYDLPRHHPLLVEAVENCKDVGSLSIAEIEGCKYYIDEYDGLEGVMTPDNINWIIIDNKECRDKYPEYFI